MGSLAKDILSALFMGMILPGILLNAAEKGLRFGGYPQETAEILVTEPTGMQARLRSENGTVTEGDMDDYLVGVLLAEIPASFEAEALKAQAVAARTYACKAMRTGGKHGDGSVCLEAACCQAWLSREDYLSLGGTEEGIAAMTAAVGETSDEVLTYEGELIEATYFSSSGGRTEAAVEVWGSAYPYLQSVDSPEDAGASHTSETCVFTHRQFQDLLGVILPEEPQNWIGDIAYTEGGGVATMEIGGQVYSGTELRRLLGLYSTVFRFSIESDTVTVTTRGYGHRVGMSQYGAEAMAVAGSTYEQILGHYYPGTAITSLD